MAGSAPVDAGDGVALGERAELPEAVALANPAAAVHALGDRVGHALRGDEQGGQPGTESFGAAGTLEGGCDQTGRPIRRGPSDGAHQTAWPMRVSMTSGRPTPSARAGEVERHAVAQAGRGERGDVVQAGSETAVEYGAGAHGEHQGLGGARAGPPGDVAADRVLAGEFGAAFADQVEDSVDDLLADRDAADERLSGDQLVRGEDRAARGPGERRWWRAAWCARRRDRGSRR